MTDSITDAELDAIAEEVIAEEVIAEEEVKAAPKKSKAVKTFNTQAKLLEDLSFSQNNLDDAMMNQASLFSYYATNSAKAGLQSDRLKVEVEYIEALIHKDLHEQAIANGSKITEAAITKMIKLDSRYMEAISNYNTAKMVAAAAKSTTEAFSQRRDMLIQIGKDQREDRLGEIRISAGNEAIDSLKRRALESVKKG
jgi:hypothetical protein